MYLYEYIPKAQGAARRSLDSSDPCPEGGMPDDIQVVFSTKHLRLLRVKQQGADGAGQASGKTVVFFHGAPQSFMIWKPYWSMEALVSGRDVLLVSFPSNDSDAPTPRFADMLGGTLVGEFAQLMAKVEELSPNKMVIVAHDYGATFFWQFMRAAHRRGHNFKDKIELMIDCSVGSTFRFDMFEFGPGWALMWLYSIVFAMVYFIPGFGRLVEPLLNKAATYPSDGKGVSSRNMWWYSWQGTSVLFRTPFDLFGVTYLLSWFGVVDQGGPSFTAFTFPILFTSCSAIERFAYTHGFVEHVRSLSANGSRFVEVPARYGHYFPSTQAGTEWLSEQIVQFLAKSKPA